MNATISGVHHLLAAIKDWAPACRFLFAGSSEMFGKGAESPQTSTPRSIRAGPAASPKATGYDLTRNYCAPAWTRSTIAGNAKDYVAAGWRMLQSEPTDDQRDRKRRSALRGRVLAAAFAHAGLEWQEFVKVDAHCESHPTAGLLVDDPVKTKRAFAWSGKTNFKHLVAENGG